MSGWIFSFHRSYDIEDASRLKIFVNSTVLPEYGMKCKAHAGEFGNADSVRKAAEVLGLDEIQHGIGAAESPEVMKWLQETGSP